MNAATSTEPRLPARAARALRGLALLVGLVLVAVSCQQLPLDAGIEPLDAPRRWWNFYRRGLVYSLAGEWQKAALDFEIALGRRRGALFARPREERRAKTYGLHTLDDYFPHRELGICRFRLGQLEAADRELRTSLDQLPSARARYYLNEVHRATLQTGVPGAGPEIRIDQTPTAGGLLLVNQLRLELTGTLSSPAYIARVVVNGRSLPIELASPEYPLSETIALEPGEQEVTVDAEDLLGNQAHWRGRVAVDLSGPEIALARPPGLPTGTVLVTVSDDRGLAAVTINGRPVPVGLSQTTVSSPVPLRGLRLLRVEALDLAGNRTALQRSPADLPQASLRRGTRAERQWAGMVPDTDPTPVRALAQAAPAPEARPDVPPTTPAATPAPADTLPPALTLTPAVDGPISVTGRTYVVDVEAVDQVGVAAITFVVNGAQETYACRQEGTLLQRLTHTVHLQPGPNTITISVRDTAGNVRSETLSLRLAPDPAWRPHLRAGAHVMPTFRAGPTASPPTDLYPLLLAALGRDPARLTMVERDPEVMRAIFRELGISGSSLADARTAIRANRIATAEYILVCRSTVWSGPDNYDLVVELVDTATSEVVLVADVHFISTAGDHIERQLGCLVAMVEQQLPRLTTRVASCSGKRAVLPVGSSSRVRRGMYALFLEPASANPAFAAPLQWEGRWIQGRVEAVDTDACEVILEPKEGSRLIRPQGEVTFR